MTNKTECARCGSMVERDELGWFFCSQCKDITFPRERFEEVIKKLALNFDEARNSDFGLYLKNLYLFGCYAEGKAECRSVKALVTYDKEGLNEWIDSKFDELQGELLVHVYDVETEEWNPKDLIAFLDNSDFFEFRKCDEYPECLWCYEKEGCAIFQMSFEEFWTGLHEHGVHNYCIEQCDSTEREKIAIPPCCEFGGECSFTGNSFRDSRARVQIFEKLNNMLKKDMDLAFDYNEKEVNILDISSTPSLHDFQTLFKHYNFNFTKVV